MAAESHVASPRVLAAGDAAITIEFGDAVDRALLGRVAALDRAIAHEAGAGRLPGLVETMPTFRSLTVFYDPLVTGREALLEALRPLWQRDDGAGETRGRAWRLPVCYEGDAAPDLHDTAEALGLAPDEVVALHSGTLFTVYMLGFLPGFPFLGDLPAALQRPRRTQPRVRVPAGSVAVAGGLSAIYPWESPGGWHLLGRCPVRLFDARRASPSLLAAGDTVRFAPVDAGEFARLQAAVQADEIDPLRWAEPAEPAESSAAP